jgi:hypothetical protein
MPRTSAGLPVVAGRLYTVFHIGNILDVVLGTITDTVSTSGAPMTLIASGSEDTNADPPGPFDAMKWSVFRATVTGTATFDLTRVGDQGMGQVMWTVIESAAVPGAVFTLGAPFSDNNMNVLNDSAISSSTIPGLCAGATLWGHGSFAGSLSEAGATGLFTNTFPGGALPGNSLSLNVLSDTDCSIDWGVTGQGNPFQNASGLITRRQVLVGLQNSATIAAGGPPCTIPMGTLTATLVNPNTCNELQVDYLWADSNINLLVPAGAKWVIRTTVNGVIQDTLFDNRTGTTSLPVAYTPTAQNLLPGTVAAGGSSAPVVATVDLIVEGAAGAPAVELVTADLGRLCLRSAL